MQPNPDPVVQHIEGAEAVSTEVARWLEWLDADASVDPFNSTQVEGRFGPNNLKQDQVDGAFVTRNEKGNIETIVTYSTRLNLVSGWHRVRDLTPVGDDDPARFAGQRVLIQAVCFLHRQSGRKVKIVASQAAHSSIARLPVAVRDALEVTLSDE